MAKSGQQRLMHGALLLTVTSFIVKILSAIYRVPFQNMVGDEGFYAYQQVYPIYGIAMTLALSGLPVFLSKLVAEQETEGEKLRVVRQIFPLILWLSLGLFAVTFFGGNLLAQLMGDQALSPLIKMVSFVFLLTPFLTSYRGYFQGELVMAPTAYSQLWEQVLRVGVILVAAFVATYVNWSIYQVGTIAMAGALVGGLGALIILWRYRPGIGLLGKEGLGSAEQRGKSRPYIRRFLVEGGLICGYSSLLVIFQLIDSFVIKNQLVLSGMTNMEAKVTKGIYDRGQPLVQVGLVIAIALTTSFLPTLTKYHMANKEVLYERAVATFLRITVVISSAASVGLIMLLPYVNSSLFGDNRETVSLSLFMGTIFLMSMVLAFQTLFQSRNHYRPALVGLVSGCAVKAVVSPLLTGYLGTAGASLATLIGLGTCLVILIYSSPQMGKAINSRFVWKLSSCLGMMVISLAVYRQLVDSWLLASESRLFFFTAAIVGVALGGSVFLWMMVKSQLFTLREWLMIPMGKKLLRVKQK